MMKQTIALDSKDFVGYFRKLCCFINGSMKTEQIFVVVDDNLWWRMYWNPVYQNWEVASHTASGWSPVSEFQTLKLLPLISEHKETLLKARGFEHKTVSNVTVYKSSPRGLQIDNMKMEVKC